MLCSLECVDVSGSSEHCGRCGNPCGPGRACIRGTCMALVSCSAPRMMCGDVCVNPQSDNAHCGVCNNRCAPGIVCTGGVCPMPPPPPPPPPPRCGDGVCSASESCGACPLDCGMCAGRCGDGVCSSPGESCLNCSSDCRCSGGDVCTAAGSCSPCGMSGQPCCAGSTCASRLTCSAGRCACVPSCTLNCMDDGCGGRCGSCPRGTYCGTSRSGCVTDPTGRWVITVNDGQISSLTPAGLSWDSPGGAPDPYVCLTLGGARSCTRTRDDTYTPTWNVRFPSTLASDFLAGFRIEILDEDVSEDDIVCSETARLNEEIFRSGRGYFECANGLGRLNFTVVLE
ncbi:MAG: hypothetical protein HY909_26025 [Deltaproteobacteria bacterium]|nr:hypothetical protein [Deltaproteobacteria bacterium]